MISIALVATVACLAWALLLRRRLDRAADVEHELRGALTALGLAVQRQGDAGLTAAYELQLARALTALGELGHGTVAAGPGATVLGNLVANAVEHGEGPIAVRIEVANECRERPRSRGRGLRIAARAARAAGGRLDVRDDGGRFAAVLELPVER